jgi:hypothetical protein
LLVDGSEAGTPRHHLYRKITLKRDWDGWFVDNDEGRHFSDHNVLVVDMDL